MARSRNWPELLAQFIKARRDLPFEWGVNDCCTMARDWIEVCTGRRVELPLYSSNMGAARAMVTGGGLAAMVEAELGKPIAAPFAQRGDIALLRESEMQLGVVVYGGIAVHLEDGGLLIVPVSAAAIAWRV